MNRSILASLTILYVLTVGIPVQAEVVADSAIEVDFNVAADPPLVKKFGVMNSGLVPMTRHNRDLPFLSVTRPESLRIDLSIGKYDAGWSKQIVSGTAADLQYDWSELDSLTQSVLKHNVLPYWSICYTPVPLQHGTWNGPPANLKQWETFNFDFARHFKKSGKRVGYYEVFNEPDLDIFFTGTMDQYFEMYRHGAIGLRRADSDAVIGGPALAFNEQWVKPFIDFVHHNNLPLDFFSFHVIWADGNTAQRRLARIRQELSARPQHISTEIHLNEFHPYSKEETQQDGAVEKYALAAHIFDQVDYFISQTDLTLVHWAQFMDSGWGREAFGLVDVNGKLRPAFKAFAIYADLPIDRFRAKTPIGLGCLASANDRQAGVVIWNRSNVSRDVVVTLKNLPLRSGSLSVYKIDSNDDVALRTVPTFDNVLTRIERRSTAGVKDAWNGSIPPHGTVYLRVTKKEDSPSSSANIATIIRQHHYYWNRGASHYAYFDEHEWCARLGMGKEHFAHAMVGVTAKDMPSVVRVEVDGAEKLARIDENSTLNVRVDYFDGNSYRKSVLFHGGLFNPNRTAPVAWGTHLPPDHVVRVPSLKSFNLPVQSHAPDNWDGKVLISLSMQNTGVGTRAKIRMRTANLSK